MPDKTTYINQGVEVLSSVFSKEQANKIFIVSGDIPFNNVKHLIEDQLSKKELYLFNSYQCNPKLNDILDGINEYRSFEPELILAIGGGSAIDIAKSINVLACQDNNPESIVLGKATVLNKPSIPLVVMPTTAGTGSEATHFSVVYIDNKKYSLEHEYLLPDYAIIDVSLVESMPKYLSACCAFDALTQSVESYWSIMATKESKKYAEESITCILSSLIESVNEPSAINREPMVIGAYYSGKAINISKTTAPHAISYTLTSHFGVPHGHAVSALLGPTSVVSYEIAPNNRKKDFEMIFRLFNCDDVYEFYSKWKNLMLKTGLNPSLKSFGVKENDFKTILDGVNIERLSGHPTKLGINEIKKIFNQII